MAGAMAQEKKYHHPYPRTSPPPRVCIATISEIVRTPLLQYYRHTFAAAALLTTAAPRTPRVLVLTLPREMPGYIPTTIPFPELP